MTMSVGPWCSSTPTVVVLRATGIVPPSGFARIASKDELAGPFDTRYSKRPPLPKGFAKRSSNESAPADREPSISRARPYTERFAVALSSGLADPWAFSTALRSGATGALLSRDLELARRYRVTATPTLFINGRRIEGVPPDEVLVQLVGRLLSE